MLSSCWAKPPSVARLGVTPISWIVWLPWGPENRHVLAQHGRGDLHPWQTSDRFGEPFGKAAARAGDEREARGAVEVVDQLVG